MSLLTCVSPAASMKRLSFVWLDAACGLVLLAGAAKVPKSAGAPNAPPWFCRAVLK
jgi:hypothetical protein